MHVFERAHAAVHDERERREIRAQLPHDVVLQRRNLAILFRAQAIQHRLARVHDEHRSSPPLRPTSTKRTRNSYASVAVCGIGSMPMRHFTVTGTCTAARIAPTHSATSDGSRHQARAEPAALHAIARAAAIQIDLVVAELLTDARRARQLLRIAAAELQRHRMLGRMEFEQARSIAADDRGRGDHFRVEQCARAQQPQEIAAMPVRVIHHWSDATCRAFERLETSLEMPIFPGFSIRGVAAGFLRIRGSI